MERSFRLNPNNTSRKSTSIPRRIYVYERPHANSTHHAIKIPPQPNIPKMMPHKWVDIKPYAHTELKPAATEPTHSSTETTQFSFSNKHSSKINHLVSIVAGKKHMSRGLVLPVVIIGSTAALLFFSFGLSKKPVAPVVNMPSEKTVSASLPIKELHYSLPMRLKIPKIEVDASIGYMGVTTAGSMAVPSNVVDVGWYKFGPNPGNKGSAVIAGHLDGLKGQHGVFFELNKLQKGDSLSTVDSNGQTISFVVQKTQVYGQNEEPNEVFKAGDGAHLNLITCTGAWDKAQHRFLDRLVVFANKST